MLFDRHIEPRCAWACRAFRYDPLKRVPPKPAATSFEKFRDEDFSL